MEKVIIFADSECLLLPNCFCCVGIKNNILFELWYLVITRPPGGVIMHEAVRSSSARVAIKINRFLPMT